jgi:Uma2 family endonuclease
METIEHRLYTADDVWQLSMHGAHYELLDGELFLMAPTKFTHGKITNWIAYQLTAFGVPRKLGAVFAAETGFALSDSVVLAPDVSYLSKRRLPVDESKGFAHVAPDLAVEVVSDGNSQPEMQQKIEAYFSAGTHLIWVVYPRSRTIYVYTAADKVTILKGDADLDGGDVLPGFALKVSSIFAILDD